MDVRPDVGVTRLEVMDRRYLAFISLAITLLYGVGFTLFETPPDAYASIGAVVVVLSWIAIPVFGKDTTHHDLR